MTTVNTRILRVLKKSVNVSRGTLTFTSTELTRTFSYGMSLYVPPVEISHITRAAVMSSRALFALYVKKTNSMCQTDLSMKWSSSHKSSFANSESIVDELFGDEPRLR